MKQGIQSTLKNTALKESGCYFLCLLRWAELERGIELDEDQIEFIFNTARRLEYVNGNVLVLLPHEILNLCLHARHYRTITIETKPPVKSAYVTYLTKPGFGHFILNFEGELWDPLPPNRAGNVGYAPASYRVIT